MLITIPDIAAMQALAVKFAGASYPLPFQLHLQGNLGAGKTTFVRYFLMAMGYQGTVKSPTYTLVESYFSATGLPIDIYHFDLYRLADSSELDDIGIRDYFDSKALCFVEWPEKAPQLARQADIVIRIGQDQGDTGSRKMNISGKSPAGESILHNIEKRV